MGCGFPDKYAGKDALVSQPDGAEPESNYQMVPMGGQRDLLVQTGAKPCKLTVDHPSLFEIKDFRSHPSGTPMLPGAASPVRLPPNTTLRFTVIAKQDSGVGTLTLNEDSGPGFDQMTVSVKAKRSLTYRSIFLSDMIHRNVRGAIDPRELMTTVNSFYRAQANLELRELKPPESVFVPKNLGNPLRSTDEALDAIEAATTEEVLRSVDITVFCCWDIELPPGEKAIWGLAPERNGKRRYLFLEVLKAGRQSQVLVLAHEIGHVLGLEHRNDGTWGLMKPSTAAGIITPDAQRLSGKEIEIINKPARKFLPP